MFINGSFNLTLPVSLALYQLELPVLSKTLQFRQVALQLFGTLSFELHTRPLPATHVEVGYCQQNDRSLFCWITVRQLYQRLFRSHNPLFPGSTILQGVAHERGTLLSNRGPFLILCSLPIKQSSVPRGLWLMMCLRMQYFKQLLL